MRPPLTLQQQANILKTLFAKAKIWHVKVLGVPVLGCTLRLRPTPTSAVYTVEYIYAPPFPPGVYLREPPLVLEAHGMRTPHLYADGTLCLYDPAKHEWTESDSIAHTIVPWSVRWLYHYEHWLAFGEWRGDYTDAPPAPKGDREAAEGVCE